MELNLQSRTSLNIHVAFLAFVEFISTDQKDVTSEKTKIFTTNVMRIQLPYTWIHSMHSYMIMDFIYNMILSS